MIFTSRVVSSIYYLLDSHSKIFKSRIQYWVRPKVEPTIEIIDLNISILSTDESNRCFIIPNNQGRTLVGV